MRVSPRFHFFDKNINDFGISHLSSLPVDVPTFLVLFVSCWLPDWSITDVYVTACWEYNSSSYSGTTWRRLGLDRTRSGATVIYRFIELRKNSAERTLRSSFRSRRWRFLRRRDKGTCSNDVCRKFRNFLPLPQGLKKLLIMIVQIDV